MGIGEENTKKGRRKVLEINGVCRETVRRIGNNVKEDKGEYFAGLGHLTIEEICIIFQVIIGLSKHYASLPHDKTR